LVNLNSSLLAEPQPDQPLDARVAKTCTKWDVAQMMTDDLHEELQALPLNNDADVPRFQRTLADYAAYMQYTALMKRRLDQLMPGAGIHDYTAILDQCYSKTPLSNVLREAVNQEIDAEIAPLMEQCHASLSAVPSSWVQRVQQSKNPLQLVKDDARAAEGAPALDGGHGR
jgi:hypothetical protein